MDFTKFDARTKTNRNIKPPRDVIDALLEIGRWRFKDIKGVIATPSMRCDGTLVDEPGYDDQTEVWYQPGENFSLPTIPASPSKKDAQSALETLKGLVAGFPFADDHSRAAALAALITPVLRLAFGPAPIFLVTAPEAGTGKSFFVTLAGMLATGENPISNSGSDRLEELEKRIELALMIGSSIMSFNNINNGMIVVSDALCQMATEGQVQIRQLGEHKMVPCDCRASVAFLNGNNIAVGDDLLRRTLHIGLDAKMVRPEMREFGFDPVEMVRKDRGKYLAAVFTIARAFIATGSPKPGKATRVAGFDDWARMVQWPLIWLGEADPYGNMDELRAADPRAEELRSLIETLLHFFDWGNFTVAECKVKIAPQNDMNSQVKKLTPQQESLKDLMSDHGQVNVKSFGHKLRRHRGKIVLVDKDQCRIEQVGSNNNSVMWRITKR